MKALAAIAIMCVAGTFALDWVDTPLRGGACGQGNNCAACHKNSAPRTHTAEFLATEHGSAAHLNRQQCLDCHQQDTCHECHSKTQPAWHTKAFCQPACGRQQRDEHALIATGHRGSRSECHVQKFQDQCASCHRPDEEDLQLRFHD